MGRGRRVWGSGILAIALIAVAGCAPVKSRQTAIVAAIEALDATRRGPPMELQRRMPPDIPIATSTDPDSVEFVAINHSSAGPPSSVAYCGGVILPVLVRSGR